MTRVIRFSYLGGSEGIVKSLSNILHHTVRERTLEYIIGVSTFKALMWLRDDIRPIVDANISYISYLTGNYQHDSMIGGDTDETVLLHYSLDIVTVVSEYVYRYLIHNDIQPRFDSAPEILLSNVKVLDDGFEITIDVY